MIEQGKQQIDEMSKHIQMLEAENDDKDDELRLKKYEIDVKAEIEFAKLAKDAGMSTEQVMQLLNAALANAAQQPELPEEGESYQHEQQEVYDPMAEQMEQEGEQLEMPMMAQNDMGGGGLSGVQLPDLQQDSEMM
jgi:hypothetical protein